MVQAGAGGGLRHVLLEPEENDDVVRVFLPGTGRSRSTARDVSAALGRGGKERFDVLPIGTGTGGFTAVRFRREPSVSSGMNTF